ncbi:tetratricopeptide repeat protein [Sungkyunkwania multivorans]|uniref:histidine kinase n=1 Tax=Sungkyunkwania multivorans TaxID=1173618 RepID=A0ABW3CV41_9FLAO
MRKILQIFFFCQLFLLTTGIYGQDKVLDSIHGAILTAKDSLLFNQASTRIGELRVAQDYKTANYYANIFIELSKLLEYNSGTGMLYTKKGDIYLVSEQYDEALKMYDSALVYLSGDHNLLERGNLYNNQAIAQRRIGDFGGSLISLQEASKIYEKLGDYKSISMALNNIGNIHNNLADFDLAEDYYERSMKMRKDHGIKQDISHTMNSLTEIYLKQQLYDRAIKNAHESIAISKELNDQRALSVAYEDLGTIYMTIKEYAKAKEYYLKSLSINSKEFQASSTAERLNRLAEIEVLRNNPEEAKAYLDEAYRLADSVETNKVLRQNLLVRSKLDSLLGDFESAYTNHKNYYLLDKDLVKESNSKEIGRLEAKFEYDRKQQLLLLKQRQQEAEQDAQLRWQRWLIYSLVGAFIALLFVLFVILQSRRVRKKYVDQLDQQAKELITSNITKDKLFSIIAHDLRNSIHSTSEALNMVKESDLTIEELQDLLPELTQKSNETSSLLTNLLHWSSSQLDALQPKKEYFDIRDVIQEKIILLKGEANEKGVDVNNKLEHIKVFADRDMMKIVVQNLLTNAIKFSNYRDTITIYAEKSSDSIDIFFKDTGVGIKKEHLRELFTERAVSTLGTKNEKGIGLGLQTCKELVELNDGELTVKSKENVGSTFRVTLPLEPTSKAKKRKSPFGRAAFYNLLG